MRTLPLRRLLVLALAAPLLAPLGGCVSLLPKTKPVEQYSFGLQQGPIVAPPMAARNVVLEPIDFPREAMSDGILTVEGAQTAFITGARWMAPAPLLFKQAVQRAFDAGGTARIMSRGETGPTSALLHLEVVRFEADYATPKGPPTVRVTLRARLTAADGRPVGATVFDVQKPVAENRIDPIAAAFDGATREALAALAQWVDKEAPEPSAWAEPRSTSSASSTKSTTTSTTTTTRQP